MNYINRRILLAKRPSGMPKDDCWKNDEIKITSIKNNQILIEVQYLSIDPYMRGRMNDGLSYAAPAKINEPMTGETAGIVVESKSNLFEVGDRLCIHQGWQTYIVANDTDPTITKINNSDIPLSVYLGTLGMPGRTAYFGLNYVGKPKPGDNLVVSAASGAVGSVVGQLAKMHGCRVIGIAGGPDKCAYVRDILNFNDCIDYKQGDLNSSLKKVCPDGIDIYFENVGGDVTRAVAPMLNKGARVPVCGFISQYNKSDMLAAETPFDILKSLTVNPDHRFFVVHEWLNKFEMATSKLEKLVLNGELKYKETITDGFQKAPQALRDVLTGRNFGKQIIKI